MLLCEVPPEFAVRDASRLGITCDPFRGYQPRKIIWDPKASVLAA